MLFQKNLMCESAGSLPEAGSASPALVVPSEFEQSLWSDFWKLADDEAYRREMGVRVVQGESVWGPFKPGVLYTITVESNGGLNLHAEPLKGVYREALAQNAHRE